MTPFFSSYQNVSLKLDSTVCQSPRKERLDFEWVIDDVMMRMADKEREPSALVPTPRTPCIVFCLAALVSPNPSIRGTRSVIVS